MHIQLNILSFRQWTLTPLHGVETRGTRLIQWLLMHWLLAVPWYKHTNWARYTGSCLPRGTFATRCTCAIWMSINDNKKNNKNLSIFLLLPNIINYIRLNASALGAAPRNDKILCCFKFCKIYISWCEIAINPCWFMAPNQRIASWPYYINS